MRCCFSMASVSVALRDSGDAHATTGPFESRFETWPMTSGIGPHAHRPPGYRVHGQRMDVHYDRSAVAHTTAAPSPPFIKLKTRIKTQLWLRQTPVGGRLIAHSTKIIVIARKTLLPGSKAAGKQGCREASTCAQERSSPGHNPHGPEKRRSPEETRRTRLQLDSEGKPGESHSLETPSRHLRPPRKRGPQPVIPSVCLSSPPRLNGLFSRKLRCPPSREAPMEATKTMDSMACGISTPPIGWA